MHISEKEQSEQEIMDRIQKKQYYCPLEKNPKRHHLLQQQYPQQHWNQNCHYGENIGNIDSTFWRRHHSINRRVHHYLYKIKLRDDMEYNPMMAYIDDTGYKIETGKDSGKYEEEIKE